MAGAWGARKDSGTGSGRGKSGRLEFLKGGIVRNKEKVRLSGASPITIPEVFAKVNSVQFLSRF